MAGPGDEEVVEASRRSMPIQRSTMAFARMVHHVEVIVSAAILCAATMLLATHSIGMGAGPVSSFSRAAARAVLRLPDRWGSGAHPVSVSSGADPASCDGATTPIAVAGPDAMDTRMMPVTPGGGY